MTLLAGIPVDAFPNYPDISETKTTWEKVQCHHCPTVLWLGEKQRAAIGKGIPICPDCCVRYYGVDSSTPISSLTHEKKPNKT